MVCLYFGFQIVDLISNRPLTTCKQNSAFVYQHHNPLRTYIFHMYVWNLLQATSSIGVISVLQDRLIRFCF